MNKLLLKILLFAIFFFTQLAFVFAGPGGKIAKVLFDTPLGKILMVVLVIVFLPVIIYLKTKEHFAIRKTRKDLKAMSLRRREYFDELSLKNRVTDVFTRVHKGWANESVEECSEFMSDWYW